MSDLHRIGMGISGHQIMSHPANSTPAQCVYGPEARPIGIPFRIQHLKLAVVAVAPSA